MSSSYLRTGLISVLTITLAALGTWLITLDDNHETDLSGSAVTAEVVKVVDGDTLDVVDNTGVKRVRLIGIDTPETVDPRSVVECFGKEASDYLQELVEGEQLLLEYDASQGELDKYGRHLVYLNLQNGTNIGEKMIRDGYAYEYTYSRPYKYREIFLEAEREARSEGLGLWSATTCGGQR